MRTHLARAMRMAICCALLAPSNAAQGPSQARGKRVQSPRAVTLADVRAAFKAADANGDGRLAGAELSKLPWGPQLLRESDHTGDGTFSLEEFVVGQHRHIGRSKRAVARDLETESTRIQTVWRARRSEELKRLRRGQDRAVRVARPQDPTVQPQRVVPSDRKHVRRVVPEVRPTPVEPGPTPPVEKNALRPAKPADKKATGGENRPPRPVPPVEPAPKGGPAPGEPTARPNQGKEPVQARPDEAGAPAQKRTSPPRVTPAPSPGSKGPAGQRIRSAKGAAPKKDGAEKKDGVKKNGDAQ